MMKRRMLTVLVGGIVALVVLVAAAGAQTATPTPAAPAAAAPSRMADLIGAALASDQALTFDFVVPLVTGERVWSVPDGSANRTISAIGADYVCFSEPWNEGSRERCTPFSNIASVTFLK